MLGATRCLGVGIQCDIELANTFDDFWVKFDNVVCTYIYINHIYIYIYPKMAVLRATLMIKPADLGVPDFPTHSLGISTLVVSFFWALPQYLEWRSPSDFHIFQTGSNITVSSWEGEFTLRLAVIKRDKLENPPFIYRWISQLKASVDRGFPHLFPWFSPWNLPSSHGRLPPTAYGTMSFGGRFGVPAEFVGSQSGVASGVKGSTIPGFWCSQIWNCAKHASGQTKWNLRIWLYIYTHLLRDSGTGKRYPGLFKCLVTAFPYPPKSNYFAQVLQNTSLRSTTESDALISCFLQSCWRNSTKMITCIPCFSPNDS